jgi:hypothetical protein
MHIFSLPHLIPTRTCANERTFQPGIFVGVGTSVNSLLNHPSHPLVCTVHIGYIVKVSGDFQQCGMKWDRDVCAAMAKALFQALVCDSERGAASARGGGRPRAKAARRSQRARACGGRPGFKEKFKRGLSVVVVGVGGVQVKLTPIILLLLVRAAGGGGVAAHLLAA